MGRTFLAATASLAVLLLAGLPSVQAATPPGRLVCTAFADLDAQETAVSATLLDSAGGPLSNSVVTFSIDSAAGSLSSSTALTNDEGMATVTLYGSGESVVAARYGGLECEVVNQVLGLTFAPPSTDGGGLASSGLALASILLAGSLTAVAIVLSGWRRLARAEDRS